MVLNGPAIISVSELWSKNNTHTLSKQRIRHPFLSRKRGYNTLTVSFFRAKGKIFWTDKFGAKKRLPLSFGKGNKQIKNMLFLLTKLAPSCAIYFCINAGGRFQPYNCCGTVTTKNLYYCLFIEIAAVTQCCGTKVWHRLWHNPYYNLI